MGKPRCSCACFAVASLLVLLLAVAAFVFMDAIFLIFIRKEGYIKPGGEVEKQWMNPNTPIYTDFYFFDITNPDEVKKGDKPSVQELGPFVYREHREKFDIQYMFDETVVQYRMDHYFTLDLEKSVSDPATTFITTLNAPLAVVLAMESRLNSSLERDIINALIKGQGEHDLFIKRTVKDLLWGYDDPIFALAHRFDKSLPSQFALQVQNITDDYNLYSRVFTGKGDSSLVGTFIQWHEMNELPYWGSPAANAINGTEGLFFHPDVKKTEKLSAYIDNLYRSGFFVFNNTGAVEGIDTVRYVIPAHELANASVNPDNKAFYMQGPSGMMNLSVAYPMNPPVFVCKPHYLDTPEYIQRSVVGLTIDPVLHDSYLDMHALTGIILNAHKRMQVNMLVQPRESRIYDTSKLREMYFPILWVDETATVIPSDANELKGRVMRPMKALSITLICLMALASLAFVTGTLFTIRNRRRAGSRHGSSRLGQQSSSLNSSAVNESTTLLQ